jgi:hypothetical protein
MLAMLSIHIQEVADYPPEPAPEPETEPEPVVEVPGRSCSCRKAADVDETEQDDAPAALTRPEDTSPDGFDFEGEEDDDRGYSGLKLKKMTDDVDYNFHEKMGRIRATYDTYVDFLGETASCRAPWTSALKVLKAKQDVDDLTERLKARMTELEVKVAGFCETVSQMVWYDWYEGVDDMTGE